MTTNSVITLPDRLRQAASLMTMMKEVAQEMCGALWPSDPELMSIFAFADKHKHGPAELERWQQPGA